MWGTDGSNRGLFVRANTVQLRKATLMDTASFASISAGFQSVAAVTAVLDGALPHWSDANRSSEPRQAFTLHVVDGAAAWSDRNWLQRDPALPFRGFEPALGATNGA